MGEIFTAIILLIISIGAFIISVRSFKEKGFLFNNAYIYASKQERSQMDKRPHYRQSAIVFLLLGIVFLSDALAVLLNIGWIYYIVIVVLIATLIYAIVSSIRIENHKK